MIRVLSGFEVMALQNISADGAKGAKDSEKVFDTLLAQIDKGNAGQQLSHQTLQEIFKDVAEGKLSTGQAIKLIAAGEKNSPQGALSFSDSGNPAALLFQDVADGTINVQTAAALFTGMTESGGSQTTGLGIGNSQSGQFLLEVLPGAAKGDTSAQTATQLTGSVEPDGSAPIAGYVVGNNRSGQFVLGLMHDVATGKMSADQAVQLVQAVQSVDQTPE